MMERPKLVRCQQTTSLFQANNQPEQKQQSEVVPTFRTRQRPSWGTAINSKQQSARAKAKAAKTMKECFPTWQRDNDSSSGSSEPWPATMEHFTVEDVKH
jgi:hypothetical protein